MSKPTNFECKNCDDTGWVPPEAPGDICPSICPLCKLGKAIRDRPLNMGKAQDK